MHEAQWRAARALLGWSQAQLAERAGVVPITVKRMEAGHPSVSEDVRTRARSALEAAGVIFVDGDGEGPGVRLRRQGPTAEEKQRPPRYTATRMGPNGIIDEWQSHASDDEDAAHRLGQHLATKMDQRAEDYAPEELVTLMRPDGEIVTVARVVELVERRKGWKRSDVSDSDLGG